MRYDRDYYDSIINYGMVEIDDNHSIEVENDMIIEDSYGSMYITDLFVHNLRDVQPVTKHKKIFVKLDDLWNNEYSLFVKAYRLVCKDMGIKPIKWEK